MSSLLNDIELDGSPDQAELLLHSLKRTITSISARRDALADQLKNYKALHGQLEEKEKHLATVTVYLGEGYFVERTRQQALEFLSGRVGTLEKAVSELDTKVKETEDSIFKFCQFNELASNGKIEKVNEEGLIFMEIQEELDEEGNVINVTINDSPLERRPEQQDTIQSSASIVELSQKKEFEYIEESLSEDRGIDELPIFNESDQIAEEDDQLQELFEDMAIIQRPLKTVNESIISQDDLLNKIDELKISPDDKFKLKQMCLEEYAKVYDTIGVLDSAMERGSTQDSRSVDISEASLDEVKSKERQEVIASIIKENNLDHMVATSTPVNEESAAIERNDILELELLADDFDDSEASVIKYEDDEEWDFDFSGGEEIDDDVDLADELLYGDRSAILTPNQNMTASDMLWDQVMKLREAGTGDVDGNLPAEVEKTRKSNFNKPKKTVRFAENLQIKEVENISESLRNISHQPKLSLYRQNLIALNRANSSDYQVEYAEDLPSSPDGFVEDDQSGNSKAENSIVENVIMENIVENIPNRVISTKEINIGHDSKRDGKRVSRFKKGILQNFPKKLIVNEALFNTANGESWNRREMIQKSIVEVEEMNGSALVEDETDAVHRDDIHLDVIERQKTMSTTAVTAATTTTTTTSTTTTNSDKEKRCEKVSRFKANRGKLKSSTITDVPLEEDRSLQKDFDEDGIMIEDDKVVHEEVRNHPSIKETTLDYLSLEDDMDTMAKAYLLGVYDDDIETVGPVVDKLDDFEVLNKMIDSMLSRESLSEQEKNRRKSEKLKSLKDYDTSYDPELDEIAPEQGPHDDEEDDGPILLDQIVENEFDTSGEFEDPDEMENGMINQEVVANYHKLRQKIIFQSKDKGFRKTDEELSVEPLDKDGNPVKVSRFKATMTN